MRSRSVAVAAMVLAALALLGPASATATTGGGPATVEARAATSEAPPATDPSPGAAPSPSPTSDPSPAPGASPAPTPSPTPSPSPTPQRTPGPEVTIPATRPAPVPRTGNACQRGQYGDVLADGTVDAGCDGVLGFAEQQHPQTLRLAGRGARGEVVAVVIDRRDIAGTILRVDEVSARGAEVTRRPLLYEAPPDLEGVDSFWLWVDLDGYEREVRVVVDVTRSSGAAVGAPPIGRLLGQQEPATGSMERLRAFDSAARTWLGAVLLVAATVGAALGGWGLARRRGWRRPRLRRRVVALGTAGRTTFRAEAAELEP